MLFIRFDSIRFDLKHFSHDRRRRQRAHGKSYLIAFFFWCVKFAAPVCVSNFPVSSFFSVSSSLALSAIHLVATHFLVHSTQFSVWISANYGICAFCCQIFVSKWQFIRLCFWSHSVNDAGVEVTLNIATRLKLKIRTLIKNEKKA